MSNNEPIGPVAILENPRSDKDFSTFAQAVHDHLLNSVYFQSAPPTSPTLAVFQADIVAFNDAATKAATKAKGAVPLRRAKRRKVAADLAHLRDYVQGVVETSATSPAEAAAMIEAAFMKVKKLVTKARPDLSVRNTGVSGRVAIAAKAVKGAGAYFWEYSLDQVTWVSAPETRQASTQVSGLTSAKVYYFRFRVLTRKGKQDPSQVVSLLVH